MGKALQRQYGRLLRVNLTNGSISVEELDPQILRQYVGGVGIAARILYDELAPGIDPFGPENKMVFATGPLTDNRVPGGGSVEVCFKSPLTNIWGESRCGGDFGPMLRKAGYDFLVVEGSSSRPVYLVISDDDVHIRPADNLVGKLVSDKMQTVFEGLGDSDYQVMCIGPGGENRVLYASIMLGGRAAGRCGGGAVMGAKQLLAVAVKGTKELPVADQAEFMAAVRKAMAIVRADENAAGFRAHGTVGDIGGVDAAGDLPTKNWQSNSWGKGEGIYDCFYNNNLVRNTGCYRGCPVACGRIAQVADGPYKTPAHDGAEYESIAAFTSYVVNEDVDAAVHSTYLCNEYGIDTISAGAAIAFAMESDEQGLLDPEKSGLPNGRIPWGEAELLPQLVRMIATREGVGDLLADGVKRAAEKLGGRALEFAIHGKGLESPAHDPRSGKALAVTYATANRGSCHIHPVEAMAWDSGKRDFGLSKYGLDDPESVDRWAETGKGKAVKLLQDGLVLPDVFATCKFLMYTGLTVDDYAAILSAVWGTEVTGEELLKVGERVINLQRLFNTREGITREDDTLPKRMLSVPLFGDYAGIEDCAVSGLESMMEEYYAARGWDSKTGVPLPEKQRELGLI